MFNINCQTEYQDLNYQDLAETCDNCQKCELSSTRKNVVVGYGPVPCNVMAVGEGPGSEEDIQGKPFVGKAGQLLTKMLQSIDIDREKDIFITNIVKCRPPQNRNPLPTEIEACQPYLVRQIQLVQPKVLILLGSPALKTVIDDKLSITKERGKWIKQEVNYMDDLLYIMPIFHPSFLLRNESKEKGSPKWLAWKDMQEIKIAIDFYAKAQAV
ncbi:uracil-DNA glycosylase [Candidatus Margulisiibacteriota bacterium]